MRWFILILRILFQRKYEDRDDKSRKYRKSSKEHRDSREKERNRHRDSSVEKRREKYDRKETDRRSDDRRQRDRDGRDSRNNKDKYDRNNRHKDDHHRRRNDSPRNGKDTDNSHPSSASNASNSINALRKAEALNRTIERRANEKVQQLQKLGIEIPAMMEHQQQQQLLQQQLQTKIQTAQMRALNMASMLTSVPNTTMSQTTESHPNNEGNSDDNLNLNLTNFISPVLANARYTEQMQKKKLIWGAKKAAVTNGDTVTTNNKWEAAKFSQDSDGKVASKFLRLMGMKNVPATASNSTNPNTTETTNGSDTDPSVEKREQMFNKMEQQYEIARQVTHTMRGMGLGFGSQSRPC